MADYHSGLHLLPEHMRDSVVQWIERGEPHPKMHGSCFLAILRGDLFDAFARADASNAAAMGNWARYLHNYAPSPCYGTDEKLIAWHNRGGLVGKP